ncbi:MAG TPA: hypothetical protein VEQ59_01280 [Polyangiaceae bacterium]|nr:hypothetical protein [Polyangiaceae bacterium]
MAFVTPPPAQAPGLARPHVDCTTSYLWPIVDSVVTAYQLAGVAYVATLDDSRFRRYPISRGADMALGAGFAAAFAGSAIYGYVSASRCRRIRSGPPGADYVPGISRVEGVEEPNPVPVPVSVPVPVPVPVTEAPFSRHHSQF